MNLIEVREKIDKIDEQIILKLVERLDLMQKVAENKKNDNKNIEDKTRELQVLENVERLSKEDAKYVKEIFEVIMKVSKDKQKEIIKR